MEYKIELITILKELHNISGFRISVYDVDLNEICAYPKELSKFCSYIQESEAGKCSCKEYDRQAFEKVRQSGETYIYQCKFGLYEAVSPLYHFGALSGYLMMGQTLDSSTESTDYVYRKALEVVSDKDRLIHTIQSIPISSLDKISSCINIMKVCAAYITLSNGWKLSERELSSKIIKYLNRNYADKITLDTLSDIFYCSKSTITTTFKKSYGKSVMTYLTEIRLEQARKLLENDKLSIKSIAGTCGFSDQNYFAKVFLRHFHVTPSEYRTSL